MSSISRLFALGLALVAIATAVASLVGRVPPAPFEPNRDATAGITLDDVRRRMARDLLVVLGEAHAQTPPSTQRKPIELPDIERLAKQNGYARVVVSYKGQAPAVSDPSMTSRANYWFWKQVGMPAAAPPKLLGRSRFVRKDVNEAELKSLAADPKVDLIVPDIPIPPALGGSGPMVRPSLVTIAPVGTRPAKQPYATVVLDSGVEADHPFLEGAVLTAFEACFSSEHLPEPYRAESLCPDASLAMKGQGAGRPCDAKMSGCDHGTHVAGIVAGWPATNAGQRISGVAPGVPIIPVQIYSRFKSEAFCDRIGRPAPCIASFISDQVAALDYAKDLSETGIAIGSVNMSLAISTEKGKCDTLQLVVPIAERIRELKRLNIPTVISAGNDGTLDKVSVPACIEDAVTVAATDRDGKLAIRFPDAGGGTNYSDLVDLAAPGVGIVSSVPGKVFAAKSGTSMAAPHVAALLAVIRHQQPTANIDEQLRLLTARASRFVEHPTSGLKRPVALFLEDTATAGVGVPASAPEIAVPAPAGTTPAATATRGIPPSAGASVLGSASGSRLILDFGDEDPVAAEKRIRELLKERGISVLEMQNKASRLGVVITEKPIDQAVIEAIRKGAQIKGLYLDVPLAPPK